MLFKKNYKRYIPGQTDTEIQHIEKLNEIEMLILKPISDGNNITNLTESELNKYLKFNIQKLQRQGINDKLLLICKSTQSYIKEHYEELLKIQKERKEKEDEER